MMETSNISETSESLHSSFESLAPSFILCLPPTPKYHTTISQFVAAVEASHYTKLVVLGQRSKLVLASNLYQVVLYHN